MELAKILLQVVQSAEDLLVTVGGEGQSRHLISWNALRCDSASAMCASAAWESTRPYGYRKLAPHVDAFPCPWTELQDEN